MENLKLILNLFFKAFTIKIERIPNSEQSRVSGRTDSLLNVLLLKGLLGSGSVHME